jgi:hypothetical protein
VSTTTDGFQPAIGDGPAAPATGAEDMSVANLDKVRDLLFGAQMRDYDRRFARLEERLVRDTAALSDDVRKRLAALEEFVRQQTQSLADRLTSEYESRSEATAALSRELHELTLGLQRRAGALDDQLGRAQRDLRQQMLEQHQRLSGEIEQKVSDVLSRIQRESTELRSDKADRATLASLLTEMALRLRNELSVPGFDAPRNG